MNNRVLITGATGYIGGRLIEPLVEAGFIVRCMARKPGHLTHVEHPRVETVGGDALDMGALRSALAGVDTAYYLIHSMGSRGDFVGEDRRAAANFAAAAAECGTRRIIYLGGLADANEKLSPHLRSRHEVGEILRSSGTQVIELRASIVLGAGSLSFELIRALTERLPVMTTPRWVSVPAQPIGVDDLLRYLAQCQTLGVDGNRIYEIGGTDVVSYVDLMREYARQRGLKRLIIPLPVLTPGLSSLWLGLVTPVYARVGRKLIDSVRHPTLVRDPAARSVFDVQPIGVREAITRALGKEEHEMAESRWSDTLAAGDTLKHWGGVRFGNRLVDRRELVVEADRDAVFGVIRRIGGRTGWYFGDWLWKIRGFLDLLVGGVGIRRGRRHPDELRVGDVVDCWRVEVIEPDRTLRLAAEMKLPGRAWLEFDVDDKDGATRIVQTAVFDPVGLLGLAYWYALYPVHQIVFSGMLRNIAIAARRGERRANIVP